MKDIDKKATVIEEKLMELEEIGYKIPMSSLIDSAIRHLSCYMRGMKDEPQMQDIPTRL